MSVCVFVQDQAVLLDVALALVESLVQHDLGFDSLLYLLVGLLASRLRLEPQVEALTAFAALLSISIQVIPAVPIIRRILLLRQDSDGPRVLANSFLLFVDAQFGQLDLFGYHGGVDLFLIVQLFLPYLGNNRVIIINKLDVLEVFRLAHLFYLETTLGRPLQRVEGTLLLAQRRGASHILTPYSTILTTVDMGK